MLRQMILGSCQAQLQVLRDRHQFRVQPDSPLPTILATTLKQLSSLQLMSKHSNNICITGYMWLTILLSQWGNIFRVDLATFFIDNVLLICEIYRYRRFDSVFGSFTHYDFKPCCSGFFTRTTQMWSQNNV